MTFKHTWGQNKFYNVIPFAFDTLVYEHCSISAAVIANIYCYYYKY